eukprot:CAMPEP_0168472300 /NCGR_PEP_ID=MMETSP0228-20121227/59728_1 /TAXON_ID=133427 /ORGANISM="Protoceratium reticulatum, Strain CCCM 535 (=CCMP 1889)" /LENGTH=38 /DNA_ID= /DNA_START= /DNA_END= /DNA_ORIENTATION=
MKTVHVAHMLRTYSTLTRGFRISTILGNLSMNMAPPAP